VFDNQKVAAHPEIRMRGDFSIPLLFYTKTVDEDPTI